MKPEPVEALGQSRPFLDLQERISRAAKTDRPVILIGERGTGKELAALRLHNLSGRWNAPYITLNCASLAPSLIESELFGHEAGAFTGAVRRRKGRFELADGGTLFLDEAGNIPLTAQEKILRVVEYGAMERVGGTDAVRADARLVAATNADLRAMAREGTFREDLLDRLSFEVITLPPLRARREDILPLAGHFARRMAVEMGLAETPLFTPAAQAELLDHPWPGNIRELKNAVERMVYRSAGEAIESIAFDPFDSPFAKIESGGKSGETRRSGLQPDVAPPLAQALSTAESAGALPWGDVPLDEALCNYEVARLRQALERCQFHQGKAAEKLGLSYDRFRALYRKHKGALAQGK